MYMPEKIYKGYCLVCRKKGVIMENPKIVKVGKAGRKRDAVKGTCPKCKSTMMVFIKKD